KPAAAEAATEGPILGSDAANLDCGGLAFDLSPGEANPTTDSDLGAETDFGGAFESAFGAESAMTEAGTEDLSTPAPELEAEELDFGGDLDFDLDLDDATSATDGGLGAKTDISGDFGSVFGVEPAATEAGTEDRSALDLEVDGLDFVGSLDLDLDLDDADSATDGSLGAETDFSGAFENAFGAESAMTEAGTEDLSTPAPGLEAEELNFGGDLDFDLDLDDANSATDSGLEAETDFSSDFGSVFGVEPATTEAETEDRSALDLEVDGLDFGGGLDFDLDLDEANSATGDDLGAETDFGSAFESAFGVESAATEAGTEDLSTLGLETDELSFGSSFNLDLDDATSAIDSGLEAETDLGSDFSSVFEVEPAAAEAGAEDLSTPGLEADELDFDSSLDFDLGLDEADPTTEGDLAIETEFGLELGPDLGDDSAFNLSESDPSEAASSLELDLDLENQGDEDFFLGEIADESPLESADGLSWEDLSAEPANNSAPDSLVVTPADSDELPDNLLSDIGEDLWATSESVPQADPAVENLDLVDSFFDAPEADSAATTPDLTEDFLATDTDLENLLHPETETEESLTESFVDDGQAFSEAFAEEQLLGFPEIETTGAEYLGAEIDFLDQDDLELESEAPSSDVEAGLDEPNFAADFLALETETDSGFDELDLLLNDDELALNSETDQPPSIAIEESDNFSNDFSDLDALLQEDSSSSSSSSTGDFLGSTEMLESPLDNIDDEFEDLEKLLEEADQLGGSAPAMGLRRSQAAAARRLPRRSGVLADQTMRVSVKHLDNLSNLVGELVVNRNSLEQDQERLRQFLDNLLFQVQQLNDVGQRMRDLYERSLLESSLISSRQAFQPTRVSDSSHATGLTFDALEMDRFTGFHTLSQEMIELIVRVRESSSDIAFTIESTDQITRQFRQVTTQLQEGLNKARMVPFAQTADRLPRAVRDISLKCGKEAKLVVEGRDTLIDKMILERLYDPMTHLVNNAITHGIETPEERLAAGKPREGTITVRAFYQGNQTVIYIADDGAGIHADMVKEKAVKRGLVTPAEARAMTKLDVYELLFLPGFSTRDQADDFAGRGVGMDVVRTTLSEIRGSVTIDSEMGKGTSFTVRLPLTLSISKALSCVNNQARIAFPMDGVEDMFDAPRERVQANDQGQSCILWRDTLLPFRPLSDLLQFNRTIGRGRVYGGHQEDDIISIVVLRSANAFIALEVDQVIGEQEIVIKQLEGPVPKPTGIAGATVLGDGRVMPIADVLELIDLSMGRVRRDPSVSLWAQSEDDLPPVSEAPAKADPTVLIVDDSITVRELLSMSFNKVGYRVEQARDGQEAWEKLRSGLPCDLVFCDIEMPRMDGLELLSRMQKDSALSHIPIAMLTSRGADRHRQMAVDLGAKGYFTKPYLEEMLLDAAQRMLNGEDMVGPK
ncbi:MAG: hybrid sensor histidine kinase/response regulator, partial [Cyanobacteria bacterium Co-bin8]|nr:hybrid sensor histidine kinase/response regulator [Cyanobacteria bacterium Co-bin8]